MAGLAAVIAGAISVAIGDHVSSKSELEYFESEINRENPEVEKNSRVDREEVRQIYMKKAKFTEDELSLIVNRITSDKKTWLDTMTKDELGLVEERFVHPLKVALVMMIADTIGGLVPLAPYIVTPNVQAGFLGAIVITFTSLFVIGAVEDDFHKEELAEVWAGNGCCRNPRNSNSLRNRKPSVITHDIILA